MQRVKNLEVEQLAGFDDESLFTNVPLDAALSTV
jgi:hypothetical protein